MLLCIIDSIREYQQKYSEYTAYVEQKNAYEALPFYKKWFEAMPTKVWFPTFYPSSEFTSYTIGHISYSIKVDIRAYNGEFFLAMAEETPDGIQGCQMNLNGEISGMLGGKYGCSVAAKAFMLEILRDLKSIL